MTIDETRNPFAPPSVEAEKRSEVAEVPATRWRRLLARLIDQGLAFLLYLSAFTIAVLNRPQTMEQVGDWLWINAFYAATTAPLSIVQWVLLARTGQSLGKKLLKLRVVRADGRKASFLEAVVLREWLTGVIHLIPGLGDLINIAGYLLIAGSERRCLHDRFAGTMVVQVRPGSEAAPPAQARPHRRPALSLEPA